MFVRGQSFLSGLGEFPGTAYAGRNAAEVAAMERCLSRGGRCRVLEPGAFTPGYFSQEGFCPGPANVRCVFPIDEAAASSQGSSAPAPGLRSQSGQPGHEAGHTSILNSLFNRPGGSAAPGMPGNVNVAPGQPPLVDQSGVMRTFSAPITGLSTGAKWAMAGVAAVAAIALAIAIFKKPKGAGAKTANRRRRNAKQLRLERPYHYRGDIERSHGLRGYKWHAGYSSGKPGVIEYPWMTKAEARKEAARAGFRAVFYRDGRRENEGRRQNGRVFARQRRVAFNADDLRDFRAVWPASGLHGMNRVWFEFASNGDLVDAGPSTRKYDSPALSALAGDAQAWLFQGKKPYWMSR